MKISLFCASIRPHNWERLLNSLKKNTVEYEVVMAGFIDDEMVRDVAPGYNEFRYIKTENIKPAQAYEVARRACKGAYVMWISDDCEFPEGYLDKIYNHINALPSSVLLACQTEDPECVENDLNTHRFFARNLNTPLVAQVGCMSRMQLEQFGGFDRKYIFGKFETDLSMRVCAEGGRVVPYTEQTIKIEHSNKNGHLNNDWSGVNEDSEAIEKTWVVGGYKDLPQGIMVWGQGQPTFYWPVINREVTLKRQDAFEPYEDKDILTISQGGNIPGRWV